MSSPPPMSTAFHCVGCRINISLKNYVHHFEKWHKEYKRILVVCEDPQRAHAFLVDAHRFTRVHSHDTEKFALKGKAVAIVVCGIGRHQSAWLNKFQAITYFPNPASDNGFVLEQDLKISNLWSNEILGRDGKKSNVMILHQEGADIIASGRIAEDINAQYSPDNEQFKELLG